MAYTFTRTGAQIEEIHNTVDDLPNIVSNGNLIANASFDIAGSVTNPPDATPRSYSAGDELFLGFKAVGALSGVTYINGKLNGTGQLYVDIYKTEKQKLSTALYAASIASSDGVAVESGASFVDNDDYWRVTFDMNDTFSVKLEQGSVATGHETKAAGDVTRYEFDSVAEAVAEGAPIGSSVIVNDYYGGENPNNSGVLFFKVVPAGTGITDGGKYIDCSGGQLEQNMKVSPYVKDFGARGDDLTIDTASIQAAFDYCRINRTPVNLNSHSIFIIDKTLMPAGDGEFDVSLYEFSVIGDGYSSILKTNTPDIHMISTDSTQQHLNMVFRNFTMINSGDISTAEKHCLNMYHTKNLTVEDMLFINSKGDGVYLRDVNDSLIRNIYCKDTRRQGVALSWGDNVTIEHIRGEGELINLADLEPNPGDIITNATIRDVKLESDTIASVRVLGQASATIDGVTLEDIQSSTLAANYVSDLNASNIRLNSNTLFDTLTLDNCVNVNFSNVQMPDQNVASGRLKLTGCDNVNLSSFIVDCVGDSGISTDLLECSDVTLRDIKLKNPSVGYRIRNCSDITLDTGKIDGATTAILSNPITQNTGIKIKNIRTPSCGTALSATGTHDHIDISDSDFSGATTKLSVSGFAGNYAIRNVKGVMSEYWGGVPTSGAFTRGDRVYRDSPSTGGKLGWVCVASGSPGTWREFGAIL